MVTCSRFIVRIRNLKRRSVAFLLLSVLLVAVVAGSVYYSLVMQSGTEVSPPPVELQEGTAGNSTIYQNGTSALVSVSSELPGNVSTYYPGGYNVLTGSYVSGSLPTSVESVDSNFFVVQSAVTSQTSTSYYPSGYSLLGSTTLDSGSVSNLTADDGVYMTFKSYVSNTSSDDSNAFIAYQNGTGAENGIPRYRTWNGTAWSNQSSMPTADSPLRWVRSVYSSYEIRYYEKIVVTLSDNQYLDAYVWNGSAWSNSSDIGQVGVLSVAYRSYDVKYEKTSGDALLVWSTGGGTVDMQYKIWNGTAWSSAYNLDLSGTASGTEIYWIAMAQNPTDSSNELALIAVDGTNSDAYGVIWNGTAWGNEQQLETSVQLIGEEGIAVEYEQTSGYATFVWGSAATMYSRQWNGTAWDASPTTFDPTGPSAINWISLEPDPASDRLMLVSVDGASDLNTAEWNGTAWTTHAEHDTAVNSHAYRCADVDWEPSGSNALLVWGTDTTNLSWKSWNGTDWSSQSDFNYTGAEAVWVQLRRDRRNAGTVKIFVSASDVNMDGFVVKWNGTALSDSVTFATTMATTTYENFDLAFDNFGEANEYTAEVEFTGTSNTYTWTQLYWAIDSAWDTANVTVTLQLYNYSSGSYPTSGDGFINYTSSATPNTDETKNQTITTSPENFRNSTGAWKVRVTGVKSTTTQFTLKVDLVEFRPSYNTEYTASTEFTFSGMITNTPLSLNFTLVSQYDLASVNVTIQVYNYMSSSYITSGQGYLSYISSSTPSVDETKTLNITTSPEDCVSNGNAKMKVTGVKDFLFNQKVNQLKLDYEYARWSTHYPGSYNVLNGTYVSGSLPSSVTSIDASYFIVRSMGTDTSVNTYNPSGNTSLGSTSWVSGSLSDLTSDNGAYMIFRSYPVSPTSTSYFPSGYTLLGSTSLVSGTVDNLVADDASYMTLRSYATGSSSTEYAHNETQNIGGTDYYTMKTSSADGPAVSLEADASSVARVSFGNFTYSLTGVSSIPSGDWTFHYRASKNGATVAFHCDVDIKIRMANGTVRQTIATNVANSTTVTEQTPTYETVNGTYSFPGYTVVNQTDYLEINYYADISTLQAGKLALLRIDDSGLATSDQTRLEGTVPADFVSEVEFTGASNIFDGWTQLFWNADQAYTLGTVNVTMQLYNYTLGDYPTSGDGYINYNSSSTPNTDETKNQTITTSPTDFRSGGGWKLKIRAFKNSSSSFDMKVDLAEYEPTYGSTANQGYNPTGYTLLGNTTLSGGSVSNLTSNDGSYMIFRGYATGNSSTLYVHNETRTIASNQYYEMTINPADIAGATLQVDTDTLGRKLFGNWTYPLTGVSSIPSGTWTFYYRTILSSAVPESHCDVDILVRMANGTVRQTIATDVANSSTATNSWQTLTGTYNFPGYTVVNQTDYLEIDFYGDVTTVKSGAYHRLQIDDDGLAYADQTRLEGTVPVDYVCEVELTGSSNDYDDWTQLVWNVDSAWTNASINMAIQVYNYTLGDYPTSGDGYINYTSSATPNTDETKNQTITTSPQDFRNSTGWWKIKIKGVKNNSTIFESKVDWAEFKPTHINKYICEVELYGSSNTYNWQQLFWNIDSAWTIGSVSATLQLYNYTLIDYSRSGDGYINYTSSATPNTDETKNQNITTSPQNFRNSTGWWKIRITGEKTTTYTFDLKVDLTQYNVTHYSEYTVSTEFTFSDLPTNTPNRLILKVVSQYDVASTNATVQVYNTASSSYPTSGEAYLNYVSSSTPSTDDTKILNITTSPEDYVSSGNTTIKVTGVKQTTYQFSQKANQLKLDVRRTASSGTSVTDIEDYVDNNTSNVDFSVDKGTHSNFTAQKYGPDSINDTLTEADAPITYEYIWISGGDDYVRKLYKSDPGGTEVLSWDAGTSYPFGCEFRIVSGTEYIYVADYGADLVTRYFAVNGSGQTTWDISGFSGDAYGLAWNGSKWFVADRSDDLIYGADWGDASADMSFYYTGISYVEGLAYDGTYLWAVDMGTDYVYKLVIPASGFDVEVTPTASWDFTPNDPTGIAYDTASGHLWIVSSATDLLYEHYINGTQIDSWDPSGADPEGVAYASIDDTSYQLDLEVQWTNVDYDEAYEFLCIYGGTMGAENIRVDAWSGSGWENVFFDLDPGWNNESVNSYLTSSNFTIRFNGGSESGDTTQHTWNIDAALLHVWASGATLGDATTVTADALDRSVSYGYDRAVLRTTDPNNTLHVFQLDNSSSDLWWWKSIDNGGTWSKQISSSPDSGITSFSVTKDSSNYIHLVYAYYGRIRYIKVLYNATSWPAYIQIDTDNKWQTDIAIAPYNNSWIYVAYDFHSTSGGVNNEVLVAYSTDGGTSFSDANFTVLSEYTGSHTAGMFPSVTIDNTKGTYGHIYVTWFKGDLTLYIKNGTIASDGSVTWRTGSDYAITNSMSSASTTVNTNMMHSAMYLNGKYCVVYCESGTAKYNDWDEILFFSGEIPLATVSHYPSITYDWNNYTYVFYQTNASNSNFDIRYQRSVDTTPSDFGNAQNVTADNNGNKYVSTKLGGDNNRVEFVWTYNTSSPYSVKYNYLTQVEGDGDGGTQGDFNYVLKIVEKDGSDWKVRLKAYDQTNIDRLTNLTIYIYDGSNSTQIVISNGAYSKQTGPWYDLNASDTEYIWMHAETSSAGTSYIYVYLEILVPNKTVYARYIITFEIT